MVKRTRSPNYPQVSLPEALELVRKIYEVEGMHSVDRAPIAKAMGYGSLNGKSRSLISALSKFSLLENTNDGVKLTDTALDLILHKPGEPEFIKAVRSSALAPGLFKELNESYGLQLPSDMALRTRLLKQRFNPKTVDEVIRSYRETMNFLAEAELSDGEELGNESDLRQDTPSAPISTQVSKGATDSKGNRQQVFQIGPNCDAYLTLSGDVTHDALSRLIKFIELMQLSYSSEAESITPTDLKTADTNEVPTTSQTRLSESAAMNI